LKRWRQKKKVHSVKMGTVEVNGSKGKRMIGRRKQVFPSHAKVRQESVMYRERGLLANRPRGTERE